MSIPPNLLAAARSSYRNVLKAGTKTFQGDARLLEAWREKARNEFVKGRSITDVRQYQDRVTLANEVATVLRTNIVQAEQGGSEVWTLRLTNDTEIGDNMTIKNPEPVECKGSKARRKKAEAEAAQQATDHS